MQFCKDRSLLLKATVLINCEPIITSSQVNHHTQNNLHVWLMT